MCWAARAAFSPTASISPAAATSCSTTPAAWGWRASSPSSKTAPYRSGRSKSWLKTKCVDGHEFVIIGYVPSTTQRKVVGSLVVGHHDKGKLVYAGRVGSGFSSKVAEDLWRRLEEIRTDSPPLDKALPAEAGATSAG